MSELDKQLADTASLLEIDVFGIADLSKAKDFIRIQGGENISNYPTAISIGIRLIDGIVNELYRHEELTAIYTYKALYNTTNAKLDKAAHSIARFIQKTGFNAYPIPASQIVNPRKLEGAISHKLVANLAGLGWIGKSCLLISPEYGPRIRYATVLTDAPLKTGGPVENRCGDCRECVDICPVKAFTGVPFTSNEPRSVRFKAHSCKNYTDKREKTFGEGICGLCVYACPYGKKNK
jgi:epoxyqueuosine reductase